MFIQETYEDSNNAILFRKNNLIAQMFERSGMTLEEITTGDFSDQEKQQFCELMGLPLAQLAELSFYGHERAKEVHDHHLTVDGPGYVTVLTPRRGSYTWDSFERWMRYNACGVVAENGEDARKPITYHRFESKAVRKAAKQLADMGIQILKVKVNYDQV